MGTARFRPTPRFFPSSKPTLARRFLTTNSHEFSLILFRVNSWLFNQSLSSLPLQAVSRDPPSADFGFWLFEFVSNFGFRIFTTPRHNFAPRNTNMSIVNRKLVPAKAGIVNRKLNLPLPLQAVSRGPPSVFCFSVSF